MGNQSDRKGRIDFHGFWFKHQKPFLRILRGNYFPRRANKRKLVQRNDQFCVTVPCVQNNRKLDKSWETYKELKDDAAVWVDVLKGDCARLLEINGIHQSGCALIRVGSNVISLRNPC